MTKYIGCEVALAMLHKDEFGTPDERWHPESEIAEAILRVPAADVAPVIHAEWFDFSDPVLKWQFTCYCSNCHEKSIRRYPYCPGCGARMDKDNNGKSKS